MDISYPQHMNILTLHNITQVVVHFFFYRPNIIKNRSSRKAQRGGEEENKDAGYKRNIHPKTHKTAQTKDRKKWRQQPC